MRRVTFVDQFYYPDVSAIGQLLTELTIGLQRRGWRLRVVTSSDEYARPERPGSKNPEELGIEVSRTPSLGGSIRSGKLLRQLFFCAAATLRLLCQRSPDLYVTLTTPPLIPVCVASVARIKSRPYVVVAQDVYPEILIAHGMTDESARPYRLVKRFIDWAYQGAEKVISLGPYMGRRLLEKGVEADRIREIPNYDVGELYPWTGLNKLRREWGLEDHFVILYSGNMGLGHEFETFLQGARRARELLPGLAVLFVGGGPRREEILARVRELGMEEWVQFRPYQPQDRLRESLGVADLSLVTMREGWEGLIVPSKILGILAMGSPTLYVGPESDISDFLERFSAGVRAKNGDVEGVRDAIIGAARHEDWRRAMGENARRGYVGSLSREAMFDLYDATMSQVLEEQDQSDGEQRIVGGRKDRDCPIEWP